MATSTYVFPQEGLDYLLSVVPKGATPSGIYLGLFTTPWATISGYMVSGQNNILLNGASPAVAELASSSGYTTRSSLNTSYWTVTSGANVAVGSTTITGARATLYSGGVTFTNNSASTWSITGMFLCIGISGSSVGSSSGASSVSVLWYAPFADLGATAVASGDSITVTPTWQALPYPN